MSQEKQMELVIQPPPFKLTGTRSSANGNRFAARIQFETPRGPACLDVAMEIPELYRSLAIEYFHKALEKACLAHLRWKAQQQHAAGFLGLKIPNPAKILARGTAAVAKKAKQAANVAYSALPAEARAIVGPILKQVARAANPTVLVSLVKPLVRRIGSTKIPGTNIPLMALSPIGAAAVFGSKIIGEKATQSLLDEAFSTADAIANAASPTEAAGDDGEYETGAAAVRRVIGKKAVAQKAKTLASAVATNAQFAKEMGLPTLNVQPDLHDAGRIIVQTLRGVYLGNPEQRKRLETLAQKAQQGNPQARILWKLALDISDAARNVRSGAIVGDGFGPGYGQAGYSPPPPSALFALADDADNPPRQTRPAATRSPRAFFMKAHHAESQSKRECSGRCRGMGRVHDARAKRLWLFAYRRPIRHTPRSSPVRDGRRRGARCRRGPRARASLRGRERDARGSPHCRGATQRRLALSR